MKKTNHLVVVNEGCKTGGYAGQLAAMVMEDVFDYLDAPIKLVASEDVPIPYNGRLELEAIPSVDDIIKAAKEVLYWDTGQHTG